MENEKVSLLRQRSKCLAEIMECRIIGAQLKKMKTLAQE